MKRALLSLLFFASTHALADIEITGRIVDAQNKPMPRIAIELVALPTAAESRNLNLEGKLYGDAIASTTTERDGRFRIVAPQPGMHRVLVRADGALPYAFDLLPLLSDVALPPLRIDAADTLRVRTRAGVRVTAIPLDAPRAKADAWHVDERLTVSDANGIATFARGRNERLRVFAIANDAPEVNAIADRNAIDLKLMQGCAQPIAVRDAKGSPAVAWIASEHFIIGVTNDAGLLTVDAPCSDALRIIAETSDGAVARATLTPGDAPRATTTLALQAAEIITGRVLDAESRVAIANALIWSSDDPARFVRSDARGNYTIAKSNELRAAANGHLPRAEKVASSNGPTFALQPTATLSGSVVDREGRGVAGAEIAIEEWSSDAVIRFRTRTDGLASRTLTRANGTFRIDVLPRRAHTLEATRDGFAPAKLVVSEKLAPAATRSGLQLVLDSGHSAIGRIVDEESSQPIAGAELRLVVAAQRATTPKFLQSVDDDNHDDTWQVWTDADGAFRFEHLPPSRFDLVAKANGFAERTVRGIVVEDGQRPTDVGDVALIKGVALEGSVVDRRGRAIEGAIVAVHPPNAAGISGDAALKLAAGDAREARTSNDGRFALDGLTPGATLDVTARAAGYVTQTIARIELPTSDALRITLETAARVSGRVVTDDGSPVPDALISVRPADASLPATLSGNTTSSDANGTFELLNLAAGKLALSAAAKGYVAGDARLVEVADGQTLENIDLQLHRGATIEGLVLTANGTPATAARVTLRSKWSAQSMLAIEVAGGVRTDGDGRFRMEGVPPGPQSVSADQDGFQRAQRDLTVHNGINRIDLRLGEGASISGRVIDGGGRPLAGAAIALLTAGPGIGREEMSDASGAFRFGGLEAGRYQLTAQKEGYASARQDLDVASRPIDSVELRLSEGGGIIAGRVIGVAPQELAQLRISAVKRPLDSLDGMREGRPEGAASYRIEGVYAGEWRVTARLPNGRQAQQVVQVPESSQPVQLDLDMTQGLTLTGTVRGDGLPIGNATVELQGASNEPAGNAVTDAAGRFRIDGLAPGPHKLIVQLAARGVRHEENVSLTGSLDVTINF